MKTAQDSPGVIIPPPLFYFAAFLLSFLLQAVFPINHQVLHNLPVKISGTAIIGASLAFIIPALRQFKHTNNTVVTVKPATTLQTSGVYSSTRNPMYLGLILLYTGIIPLAGNWWTLILIPVLLLVVTQLIIKPEERYLERAFKDPYLAYKEKVGRWM
jgi:protein-S-isoprenylcysteine O-methyltransferase Ste14